MANHRKKNKAAVVSSTKTTTRSQDRGTKKGINPTSSSSVRSSSARSSSVRNKEVVEETSSSSVRSSSVRKKEVVEEESEDELSEEEEENGGGEGFREVHNIKYKVSEKALERRDNVLERLRIKLEDENKDCVIFEPFGSNHLVQQCHEEVRQLCTASGLHVTRFKASTEEDKRVYRIRGSAKRYYVIVAKSKEDINRLKIAIKKREIVDQQEVNIIKQYSRDDKQEPVKSKRRKWTAEEVVALEKGYEEHNETHNIWRAITEDRKYAAVLKHRSPVDCKDKIRNLSLAEGKK